MKQAILSFVSLFFLIFSHPSEAAEWGQFHANGPNNGFMPVRTSAAIEPLGRSIRVLQKELLLRLGLMEQFILEIVEES